MIDYGPDDYLARVKSGWMENCESAWDAYESIAKAYRSERDALREAIVTFRSRYGHMGPGSTGTICVESADLDSLYEALAAQAEGSDDE